MLINLLNGKDRKLGVKIEISKIKAGIFKENDPLKLDNI
jgi:hypothetical protein